MSKIYLIGIDSNSINEQTAQTLHSCINIFSTKRFQPLLEKLANFQGDMHPISPLTNAIKTIQQKSKQGNVAVLASGDPLFFGIGRRLIKDLGKENIIILPAVSAMQRAFAACKLPWDNALFVSLHGRSLQDNLVLLLSHPKICLLTDKHNSPDVIASTLLQQRKTDDSTVMVAENLGMDTEKLTIGSLSKISQQKFSPLNVMIILRQNIDHKPAPSFALGLQETEIKHSRGLITKNEVRAAVLHQLRLPAHGVLWDIGAGSGSISVEAARMCPHLNILALEKNPQQQENIEHNRINFQLSNLQLIKGEAPKSFAKLPAPNRVFIGGSGGNLAEIIKAAAAILPADGRIVITAVIEKTRQDAPPLLHAAGLKVSISSIDVSRSNYPPTKPETKFNQITIITGTK